MQLGYNEIMIVSKYFEDINDFINLEIGIKRFQGNMERFHFNPIPLNQHSRRLFPNIETFHIYNKKDEVFKDGRIIKQIIWYKVNYSRYLEEKEEGNICKNIEYTKEDRIKYGNTIPIEVNSLGNECFSFYSILTPINIPNIIKMRHSFDRCSTLTTVNIPTSVTQIGDRCFSKCTSLQSINIPTSVIEIGNKCFFECYSLTSIAIPTNVSKIGDRCFYGCKSLTSIEIPTSVTEIGNLCFKECTSLTSINIPSSITSFGIGCFYHCGCEEELKKNKTIPEYCF
ncbi:leucine rich repeat protein bspa family [Entamoeba histolytica]|uniref:Leucine rich repeat protein, BspA family n=2 Tax=Entamoeba histolytica TaxID=5759 RepID=C4MAA7_ENTH1|nr:uncharacterized protein EHI_003380 [Entamoeba histolytica HM-1:IMSS]EAL43938.1 leucine rich repeat protein, BspA family [Entamoeba histolytica HM-1:IMSS]GAT98706.1 leucine rich repeat protein bspa family [Entamoeba histolytica]|eukprot:XP_649324.1 uncharacterized protein EHI_003380 [Entamoeba histolytica HM-1:IMSS]